MDRERKCARPSLVRACARLFGKEFLSLGWLKAVNTAIGFSGPLLLKVVVDAVEGGSGQQGTVCARYVVPSTSCVVDRRCSVVDPD